MIDKLMLYCRLVRLDKPVGILLLLWPTLWALWIAAGGAPSPQLLAIFVAGTVLMRSSGCAINDWADRDFDRHVKRTAERPLTAGKITPNEALGVAATLALAAGLLVLPLPPLAWQLAVVALCVAASYPFFKRFFAIPQAYLGIAFGFGIPLAFAATQQQVPGLAWVLLAGNVCWAIAYDTAYAMVDRDDDLRLGLKTSAITFGRADVVAICICYFGFFATLVWAGVRLGLGWPFWLGLAAAAGCAAYHYTLIRTRERHRCFAAFRHNNWLGACVFAGVVAAYAIR